ncbi:MAG: DUF4142 domain-containing protein [Bacteroidales bacterium]|nr:DUF4142 domain-containing protein [Bacteroidales bacterium]
MVLCKNIDLPEYLSESYKNNLKELDKTSSKNFEKLFINHLENKLVNQIELVEAYSRRSEDNELITFSVSLLTGMHEQLNTLVSLRDKIAAK